MILPSKLVSPEEVAEHYDSLDLFYRDVWGDHLHHGYWVSGRESAAEALAQLREAVAGLAAIHREDSVCDIGCGYGAMACHLAVSRGAHVTGVTLSRRQWEVAEERAVQLDPGTQGPHFIHADWLENGLDGSCFDAAISIECFSHLEDKDAFFRETKRVLKPGGRLAMTAWIARRNPPQWAIRWLLEPICREGRYPGLANADDLSSAARSSGLEVTSWQEIGPKVKKTWRVILLRLVKRVLTRREYRRFLREDLRGDRVLTLTVLRVFIAFEIGMLDYALLLARKPEAELRA